MSRTSLVVALLIALPGTAMAQDDSTPSSGVFKTADQINSLCLSKKAEDVDACDWYIMAAHDMMKFYGDTEMGGDSICLPLGTKAEAVRGTVVAYWRNPNSLKHSAVSTIYNALAAKYPCK